MNDMTEKERFNKLVKTINENLDLLKFITVEGEDAIIAAESREDGKSLVKPWRIPSKYKSAQ